MHTFLSYDLQIPDGDRRREVIGRIESILQPYRHVARLVSNYIVYVPSQAEWTTLLTNLTTLSREIPETFRFIMSPPIDGGRYNGILPRDEWADINDITNS